MNKNMLQVVDIVEGTSVDGPGLRTSIYFAGCEPAGKWISTRLSEL